MPTTLGNVFQARHIVQYLELGDPKHSRTEALRDNNAFIRAALTSAGWLSDPC